MSIVRYCLSFLNKSNIREFVDFFEIFDPFKNSRSGLEKSSDPAGIQKEIKFMDDAIDRSLATYFSQDDAVLVQN